LLIEKNLPFLTPFIPSKPSSTTHRGKGMTQSDTGTTLVKLRKMIDSIYKEEMLHIQSKHSVAVAQIISIPFIYKKTLIDTDLILKEINKKIHIHNKCPHKWAFK